MVGLKAAATHALSPLPTNRFLELSRYYIILRACDSALNLVL
jgi:hypothetical protein